MDKKIKQRRRCTELENNSSQYISKITTKQIKERKRKRAKEQYQQKIQRMTDKQKEVQRK